LTVPTTADGTKSAVKKILHRKHPTMLGPLQQLAGNLNSTLGAAATAMSETIVKLTQKSLILMSTIQRIDVIAPQDAEGADQTNKDGLKMLRR
jgi:hypothetical protein